MKVVLKNKMGQSQELILGYSWKMFLFSFFYPLFQGRMKWFFITLVTAFLSMGLIPLIVLPFIYNKLYAKGLIKDGYYPIDEEEKATLDKFGIESEVK